MDELDQMEDELNMMEDDLNALDDLEGDLDLSVEKMEKDATDCVLCGQKLSEMCAGCGRSVQAFKTCSPIKLVCGCSVHDCCMRKNQTCACGKKVEWKK